LAPKYIHLTFKSNKKKMKTCAHANRDATSNKHMRFVHSTAPESAR